MTGPRDAALAPTVMVQGVASGVGKSVLATALCRILLREGLRVAPFKAQNVSLNSFATPDGLEIGRAQAVQAEACRLAPRVEMNPLLLKPEGSGRTQAVLLGRPLTVSDAAGKARAREAVAESLRTLRREYDVVVIEGAGSPVELNLVDRDLANMHTARLADSPVLLAGDIDRGGVFAALVGTLALLAPEDRARVKGLVVNRFRGDPSHFADGRRMLEARAGVPVLGVVPHLKDLRIADEDSLSLAGARRGAFGAGRVRIAVVRLPHISNFDDFAPLEAEPGAEVRYVTEPGALAEGDLAILPGTKATVADLAWLRERGLAEAIADRARRGAPILGVCGGCQMLGERIEDPDGVEGAAATVDGLALLPLATRFGPGKITEQATARAASASFLTEALDPEAALSGYEIHMGEVRRTTPGPGAFALARGKDRAPVSDGAVSVNGRVVGTMLHGLFENASLRRALLAALGGPAGGPGAVWAPEAEYDRLADAVRAALDWPRVLRIIGL